MKSLILENILLRIAYESSAGNWDSNDLQLWVSFFSFESSIKIICFRLKACTFSRTLELVAKWRLTKTVLISTLSLRRPSVSGLPSRMQHLRMDAWSSSEHRIIMEFIEDTSEIPTRMPRIFWSTIALSQFTKCQTSRPVLCRKVN